VIVPDMPKTRSGKIMRRVLAAISNNEDAGDISTLRPILRRWPAWRGKM
jgi:acetyl-CoA synthetase